MKKDLLFLKLSFFLVIVFYTSLPHANGRSKLDSLVNELSNAKDDTNKVNLLLQIYNTGFYEADSKEAYSYAEQIVSLSLKLNYEIGVLWGKIYLGRICWKKGKFSLAVSFHSDALRMAEEKGNTKMIAMINTYIGQDFADGGQYDKAIEYFTESKLKYEELNDLPGVANTHLLLSWVYSSSGRFPEASKENLEALKCFEALKDHYGIAIASSNIGLDYMTLGRYDEAIRFFEEANKQYVIQNDNINLSGNYIYLSSIYLKRLNYKKAMGHAKLALLTGQKINDASCIGNAFSQMADIYFKEQQYDSAAVNSEKAISYFITINAGQIMAINYATLAQIYIRLNNPEKSKTALDSAEFYTHLNNALPAQMGLYLGKQLYDSLKENWKSAYQNFYRYISIRDTMSNATSVNMLAQNQMQYDFDKKEALEKANQEKKDIRQRTIRNSIAAGLGGALIFLVVVYKQRNKISKARKRSDELLLNILPEEVAEELKEKGSAAARNFNEVTVMFTDFKGFTAISEKLSPKELVEEIHTCFKAFDHIISKYNIEKIKTIGDSYMCACGLPAPDDKHAIKIVKAALEIRQFMQQHLEERKNSGKEIFEIRIGIHTGPVVAGIVGVKKFAYDIWGDTVNIASRMESSGEAGKINISGATYELIKNNFQCTYRGKIDAKNKGQIDMYFVQPATA